MAEQSQTEGSITKNKPRFVLTCACALLTVGVALASVALVCAVGTIAVHYHNVAIYKADIEGAKSRIFELEKEINISITRLETLALKKVMNMSQQLKTINESRYNISTQSDVKLERFTNESEENCNSLTTQLGKMQSEMSTNLSTNVEDFTDKLRTLKSDILNISEQAYNFTAMDALGVLEARMKVNVSIYDQCQTKNEMCNIGRRYQYIPFYWDSCETSPSISPSDEEIVMAVNCKYTRNSGSTNKFIGTALRTNTTNDSSSRSYWCQCNVRELPDDDEPGNAQGEFRFNRIDDWFEATCTLTYTICPHYKIFNWTLESDNNLMT